MTGNVNLKLYFKQSIYLTIYKRSVTSGGILFQKNSWKIYQWYINENFSKSLTILYNKILESSGNTSMRFLSIHKAVELLKNTKIFYVQKNVCEMHIYFSSLKFSENVQISCLSGIPSKSENISVLAVVVLLLYIYTYLLIDLKFPSPI